MFSCLLWEMHHRSTRSSNNGMLELQVSRPTVHFVHFFISWITHGGKLYEACQLIKNPQYTDNTRFGVMSRMILGVWCKNELLSVRLFKLITWSVSTCSWSNVWIITKSLSPLVMLADNPTLRGLGYSYRSRRLPDHHLICTIWIFWQKDGCFMTLNQSKFNTKYSR